VLHNTPGTPNPPAKILTIAFELDGQKFGLFWQIVPARLPDLIKHPKAIQAMLQMKKLDIAELERAAQS
jgi:hypothetical protein